MSESMYSGMQGRPESSGGTNAILRNRDGIPMWSGEATLFEEYVEACLLYEQTVQREKRYLCGPRLAAELKGPARRVLIGKPADWLSSDGGVRRLVAALRQERGQPKVPELSELLQRYFRGTKRARGESMGDFILRKSEAYTRAQQSMARYMKEQGITTNKIDVGRSSTTSRTMSRVGEERQSAPASVAGPDDSELWLPEEDLGAEVSNNIWTQEGQAWTAEDWENWYNQRWNWSWSSPSTRLSASDRDSSEWGRDQLPEILPDFVQGWYLFMDSGLDVMERNVLHAELKGHFGVREVEQVLRKHWSDYDLKKRDAEKGRYMANLSTSMADENDDQEDGYFGELNVEQLEAEGFSAEQIEIMMTEEDAAQKAMAAMMEAKRTLKDARARQHAVKMSRQFYSTKPQGNSGGLWKQLSQANAKGPIQCFRCGGPHKIAECKEKPRTNASDQAQAVTEAAPLVFLVDHDLALTAQDTRGSEEPHSLLTTSQVVAQGKAVIDGGATRTIGSIAALEKVAALNSEKRGNTGVMNIDFKDRPVFGFGNSSKNQCASTASLSVPMGGQCGTMRVHALDQGEAPILLSVHSLRQLGALIDFEHDLAVFRSVDPTRVVSLERSSAGHQIMPLTEDVYAQSKQLAGPVPSLKDVE